MFFQCLEQQQSGCSQEQLGKGLSTKTTALSEAVGNSVGVKLCTLLYFQASQVSSKVNYDLWKCCLRGCELSSGDVWREQTPCFLIKAINAVDLLEKTPEASLLPPKEGLED